MFFLMVCHHHPDQDAARERLRPAHRAWVASGGEGLAKVLVGSALWDDAGQSTGNFGLLEAETEDRARAFAEGDPFAQSGVVADFEITRLADSFQADRIRAMTGG